MTGSGGTRFVKINSAVDTASSCPQHCSTLAGGATAIFMSP